MALCSACASINLHSLGEKLPLYLSWRGENASQEGNSELGMVHLQNALQITDQATKCTLCALIQESLFENLKSHRVDGVESSQLELSEDPLLLIPKTNLRGCPFPDPPAAGFHLTGFNTSAVVQMKRGNPKLLLGRVRLHTDGELVIADCPNLLTLGRFRKLYQ